MSRFEYECEMVCNDRTIYPAMEVLVEKEGMTANTAARFIEKDSDGKITAGRAKMVWHRRKGVTDVTSPKPQRSRTKPELEFQLSFPLTHRRC